MAGLAACRRVPPLGAGCETPLVASYHDHVLESFESAAGYGLPHQLDSPFALHGARLAQGCRSLLARSQMKYDLRVAKDEVKRKNRAARIGRSPGLTSEQPRRNPRLQGGFFARSWAAHG